MCSTLVHPHTQVHFLFSWFHAHTRSKLRLQVVCIFSSSQTHTLPAVVFVSPTAAVDPSIVLGKLRGIIEDTSACGLVSTCAKILASPNTGGPRPQLPTPQTRSCGAVASYLYCKVYRVSVVVQSIGRGPQRRLRFLWYHKYHILLCTVLVTAEIEEHASRSFHPRQVVGWPLTKSGTAEGQCLMVLQFLRQLRQKGNVSHAVAAAEHGGHHVCCKSAV